MSTQRFSDDERYAFWLAHNRKCFYRGGLLMPKEVVIDHLVPESFLELSGSERKQRFDDLGLPPDYDVRAYYNLVPTCHSCNGRKSDRELNHRHIGLDLAITRSLVSDIERRVATLKGGTTIAKVLHSVRNGVSNGIFTPEELLEALAKDGLTAHAMQQVAADARRAVAAEGRRMTLGATLPDAVQFASRKGLDDSLPVLGIADLIDAVAAGEARSEVGEQSDGAPVYVLHAHGLYIKYMFLEETLLILSYHLG